MSENPPQAAKVTWSRVARRIRVPLGFVFAAFYLWRARPDWLWLGIGAAMAGLGIFVRAMASGHVKKNEELTTTGPYAYVRNPLYLGSVLLAIGFALAARDLWIGIVLFALFALIYVPVIRSEEAFLAQTFPQFAEYAQRVPRLLPRTVFLSGITRGFSRDLYCKHREYNALAGAVAVLAALVVKMIWFPG